MGITLREMLLVAGINSRLFYLNKMVKRFFREEWTTEVRVSHGEKSLGRFKTPTPRSTCGGADADVAWRAMGSLSNFLNDEVSGTCFAYVPHCPTYQERYTIGPIGAGVSPYQMVRAGDVALDVCENVSSLEEENHYLRKRLWDFERSLHAHVRQRTGEASDLHVPSLQT